jgi:hypothetical protein
MPEAVKEYKKERLIVISPKGMWDIVRNGLSPFVSEIEFILPPDTCESTPDPYGINKLSKTLQPRPDGILLLVPKHHSLELLVPGPVLNGIPIGIIQAESEEHIKLWLHAISLHNVESRRITWAVLAMWKDVYLRKGESFAQFLRAGISDRNIEVEKWFADTISRDEVCKKLATGPQLAVYFGHGRPRGWSGYSGIRWNHISDKEMIKPCGVIISFTCDTLKQSRDITPFGCQWVNGGRACSYIGSIDSVDHECNMAFAHELSLVLSDGHCRTIGQLFSDIYEHLEQKSDLRKVQQAFNTYRIMGNPLQALF